MERALAALFALAASAHAQDVWIVGVLGAPGVTHGTVQDAIDTAAPGDTVLLRGWSFGGFTIDGKGVVVTPDSGFAPQIQGAVVVRDVPAGQTAVLRKIVQGAVTGSIGLRVQDCAGQVWIEQSTFHGAASPGLTDAARVTGSSAVTLVRCTLVGVSWSGAKSDDGVDGGRGLLVTGSDVALNDCTLTGGAGTFGEESGGDGGTGLVAIAGSSVHASGSKFSGAAGGSAGDAHSGLGGESCGVPGHGGAGLSIDATSNAVLVANTYAGAPGGAYLGILPCPGGVPGAPLAAPPGSVTQLDGTKRGIAVDSPRYETQPTLLTLTAEPGALAFALVAVEPAFAGLQGFQAPLLVDPAAALLSVGVIGPGGTLNVFNVPAPTLGTGIFGATLYVQSAFVTPNLDVQLGGASHLTVLAAGL